MIWSIEPSDDVINNNDGSFKFPENASITQYTITCDNEAGCTASTIYNLPQGCGGEPPPAPDPPEPPGPEPPGDTCDSLSFVDVGYSWCEASTNTGTFCTATCANGHPESGIEWLGIEEESDSFFVPNSFDEPVLETGGDGTKKWVFRGKVTKMNCDCSTRECHVNIKYSLNGVSSTYRCTVKQRGWPVGAEHCP